MLDILNSLNTFYFPIFQQIWMIFVSKFMVRRALSVKTYLSLGLLSPLTLVLLNSAGFVCFVALRPKSINSYGHGGTVSSPNHTFSWASLNKQSYILN